MASSEIAALLTTVPAPDPSNAGLWGRVTDAVTGQPLKGVEVRIIGQSRITDAAGEYFFNHLIDGTFSVTANREGYNGLLKQATMTIDSTTTLDFALAPLLIPTTPSPTSTPAPTTTSTSTPTPTPTPAPAEPSPLSETLRLIGIILAVVGIFLIAVVKI